jgi:cytochrome c5
MSDVAVRGVSAGWRRRALLAAVAGLLAVGVTACEPAPSGSGEAAYLQDPASRRRQLVASLVNPGNHYSALRLERYASGTANDWDRLEEWNPRVAPVGVGDLDAPTSASPPQLAADARALPVVDETELFAPEPLRALGEEAFFRYPTQLAPATISLTREAAGRYGFWLDERRGVGGLVRAEVADGSTVLAFTCATCHADVVGGVLVPGVPSAHLDLGRLIVDAGATSDGALAQRLLAWGPGRVDVTTEDASLPERISDLRPVRWLSYLQYDATVRQTGVVALAIRIETLIITSHGQAIRPPRIVTLALARYLWDLASSLPEAPSSTGAGAVAFQKSCGTCHEGPGFTGVPRALGEIGTDPTLGQSPERGTGTYRVPSLRGVGARPTLLHDGTLPDLAALLDPARLTDGYQGGSRGVGPVRGHVFGLSLPVAEREALVAYLGAL